MDEFDSLVIQFDPAGFEVLVDGWWVRDEIEGRDPRFNMALPLGLTRES